MLYKKQLSWCTYLTEPKPPYGDTSAITYSAKMYHACDHLVLIGQLGQLSFLPIILIVHKEVCFSQVLNMNGSINFFNVFGEAQFGDTSRSLGHIKAIKIPILVSWRKNRTLWHHESDNVQYILTFYFFCQSNKIFLLPLKTRFSPDIGFS